MAPMMKLALLAAAACAACANPTAMEVTADGAEHNRELAKLPDGDVGILKFAFALECLEAEFYSWAAFGHGLTKEERGNGPAPIGGKKAQLSPTIQKYAEEIARNEIAHVKLLKSVLGNVSCPQVDIGPAFAAAANAAFGTKLDPPFSPYTSDSSFLVGAFIFEDVGVTAYHGAAKFIMNDDILDAAAGILAVEAYHAGAVRSILSSKDYAGGKLKPYNVPIGDVVDKIAALRDAVDGPDTLDAGIDNLVAADSNALAFKRDVKQVLSIVYLGSDKTPGGFLPKGISVEPVKKADDNKKTDDKGKSGGKM